MKNKGMNRALWVVLIFCTLPLTGLAQSKEVRFRLVEDWAATFWVDTGVTVKSGEQLGIFIRSGYLKLGRTGEKKLMPDAPANGVIAVIGADNDDFIFIGAGLGAGKEFKAQHEGHLFIGLNIESAPASRGGYYDIGIRGGTSAGAEPAKRSFRVGDKISISCTGNDSYFGQFTASGEISVTSIRIDPAEKEHYGRYYGATSLRLVNDRGKFLELSPTEVTGEVVMAGDHNIHSVSFERKRDFKEFQAQGRTVHLYDFQLGEGSGSLTFVSEDENAEYKHIFSVIPCKITELERTVNNPQTQKPRMSSDPRGVWVDDLGGTFEFFEGGKAVLYYRRVNGTTASDVKDEPITWSQSGNTVTVRSPKVRAEYRIDSDLMMGKEVYDGKESSRYLARVYEDQPPYRSFKAQSRDRRADPFGSARLTAAPNEKESDLTGTWTYEETLSGFAVTLKGTVSLTRAEDCGSDGVTCFKGSAKNDGDKEDIQMMVQLKGRNVRVCVKGCSAVTCEGSLNADGDIESMCTGQGFPRLTWKQVMKRQKPSSP